MLKCTNLVENVAFILMLIKKKKNGDMSLVKCSLFLSVVFSYQVVGKKGESH